MEFIFLLGFSLALATWLVLGIRIAPLLTLLLSFWRDFRIQGLLGLLFGLLLGSVNLTFRGGLTIARATAGVVGLVEDTAAKFFLTVCYIL